MDFDADWWEDQHRESRTVPVPTTDEWWRDSIKTDNRWHTIAYGSKDLGTSMPGPLHDSPHVYFHTEFLCDPMPFWTVDYTDATCHACRYQGNPEEHAHHYTPQGMAGVLVKLKEPQRVWRLTGEYDPRGHGYEARWPD